MHKKHVGIFSKIKLLNHCGDGIGMNFDTAVGLSWPKVCRWRGASYTGAGTVINKLWGKNAKIIVSHDSIITISLQFKCMIRNYSTTGTECSEIFVIITEMKKVWTGNSIFWMYISKAYGEFAWLSNSTYDLIFYICSMKSDTKMNLGSWNLQIITLWFLQIGSGEFSVYILHLVTNHFMLWQIRFDVDV